MMQDLPRSIRDVFSAQRAGLLEVHYNEVILHALNDLTQAPQHLLIHTAAAIPLALNTQITIRLVLVFWGLLSSTTGKCMPLGNHNGSLWAIITGAFWQS